MTHERCTRLHPIEYVPPAARCGLSTCFECGLTPSRGTPLSNVWTYRYLSWTVAPAAVYIYYAGLGRACVLAGLEAVKRLRTYLFRFDCRSHY